MSHRFPPLQPPEAVKAARRPFVQWQSAPLPLGEVMIIAAVLLVFILR